MQRVCSSAKRDSVIVMYCNITIQYKGFYWRNRGNVIFIICVSYIKTVHAVNDELNNTIRLKGVLGKTRRVSDKVNWTLGDSFSRGALYYFLIIFNTFLQVQRPQ